MSDSDASDGFPLFLLGVLAGGIGIMAVLIGLRVEPEGMRDIAMNYSDMAAIMLGAVAVIVTVLGVFVAILAIWGYTQFRSVARSSALKYVKRQLKEGQLKADIERLILQHVTVELTKPDGPLRGLIVEQVNEIILLDAARRERETSGDQLADEEKEYGD